MNMAWKSRKGLEAELSTTEGAGVWNLALVPLLVILSGGLVVLVLVRAVNSLMVWHGDIDRVRAGKAGVVLIEGC
jgi:hypothetical protein